MESCTSRVSTHAHPAVVPLGRVGGISGQVGRRAVAAGRGTAVAAAAIVAVDRGAAVPRRQVGWRLR